MIDFYKCDMIRFCKIGINNTNARLHAFTLERTTRKFFALLNLGIRDA
jgi:hypothetical protein